MYRKKPVRLRGLSKTGGKVYKGAGFFSSFKRFAKKIGSSKIGKKIINSTKNIFQEVGKDLLLAAANTAANKGLEAAAKKGVPDVLVNVASDLTQKGLKSVDDQLPKPKLTKNEKAVSGFVSSKSQQILQDLLAGKSRGSGVSRFGNGVDRFGNGVNRFGNGIIKQEAKTLN